MKNENTDAIFSILDSQPWTDQAKAAIMGTIFAESGFDPGILNEDPKELSWGLFQYRNVPQERGMSAPDPRKDKLFNYLESQGLGRDSADGQLEYFLKDVKENYPSVYEVLTDRDATIDEATAAITNNYIMPHESVRGQRYGHARRYANLYGLDAGPESNVDIQGDNNMVETNFDNLPKVDDPTLDPIASQAIRIADQLTPEFDPALASLLFFTGMGRAANQPGSTLIGSISEGLMDPVKYLLENKRSKQNAAIDWAKALKTSKAGGSQTERLMSYLTEISPKIKAGTASPAEMATYSAYWQKLTATKTIPISGDDGVIRNTKIPGINLFETGLEIPDNVTKNEIIDENKKEYKPAQTKAAGFFNRMMINEGILRNLEADGYRLNLRDLAADKVGFGNIGVTSEGQQFYSASRNWIAAILRLESGAAISSQEYADGLDQYFPKIGDSEQTIKNKRILRAQVMEDMLRGAGEAYPGLFGSNLPYVYENGDVNKGLKLDAQGFYNFKRGQNDIGDITFEEFKENLTSYTVGDLKSLLSNPNAANLYSIDQLKAIGEELKRRGVEQ
jgi:hypothetical protein